MNLPTLKIVTTMALSLAVCSSATAEVHVKVRPKAVASGTIVRLGDVADVVSADRELAQRLAGIRLMPAPAPGTQRFVERRAIEDLVAAQGVEVRELRFDGAAKTAITTASVKTPSEVVPGVATVARPLSRHEAVLAGVPYEPAAIQPEAPTTAKSPTPAVSEARTEKLRAEVDQLIGAFFNEKGREIGEWHAASEIEDRHFALLDAATSPLVCSGPVLPAIGRQRFSVSFNTAKGAIRVPVYAEITVTTTPVVVTIRPIARGAVITAADVELRSHDSPPSNSIRNKALREIEPIIGMEASQAIQTGEVVCDEHVKLPCLVKRGEVVSLVSQAGGIRVRTTARAKQDGAKGELIQLETMDKKENIDARVTGSKEATVFALTRQEKVETPAWIETARRTATR